MSAGVRHDGHLVRVVAVDSDAQDAAGLKFHFEESGFVAFAVVFESNSVVDSDDVRVGRLLLHASRL